MTRMHIKPASSGRWHHSYSPSSLVTLDLGELVPNRVVECVPRDEFNKISAKGVVRCAPQVFPPYGKAFVKTAAFFVPEAQLIEYSEAFHSNMNSFKGKAVHLPVFDSTVVNYIFGDLGPSTPGGANSYSIVVAKTHTPIGSDLPALGTYDFVYVTDDNGAPWYWFFKLSSKGRALYKVLKGLGYDFTSYYYKTNITTADAIASASFPCDALPFLAYIKIYVDMFLNGVLYNGDYSVALLRSVLYNESYTGYDNTTWFDDTTGYLNSTCLWYLLSHVYVPHESSLYNEAWNSPNSPSGIAPSSEMISANPQGLISPYEYKDTYNYERLDAKAEGDKLNYFGPNDGSLSAFGLKLLTAFDKFVRRNGLFGSKSVQRVYARFGIKSEYFNSHFVHKIYDGADRLNFSAVVSNSDTINGANGKSLGDFAGYGAAALDFTFSHKCDEFGYIIVLNWIQIKPMLLRGIFPSVLRNSPFDFYTPEYDGKSIRAIPQQEVSVALSVDNDNGAGTIGAKKVYGFINLYDDYRDQRDVVAGDFVNALAKDFLFCRDLSVIRNTNLFLPQSTEVHCFDRDGNADLSDPFQYSSSVGDRLWLYLEYDMEAERPFKSNSEALDLSGAGDLNIPLNGNIMS